MYQVSVGTPPAVASAGGEHRAGDGDRGGTGERLVAGPPPPVRPPGSDHARLGTVIRLRWRAGDRVDRLRSRRVAQAHMLCQSDGRRTVATARGLRSPTGWSDHRRCAGQFVLDVGPCRRPGADVEAGLLGQEPAVLEHLVEDLRGLQPAGELRGMVSITGW